MNSFAWIGLDVSLWTDLPSSHEDMLLPSEVRCCTPSRPAPMRSDKGYPFSRNTQDKKPLHLFVHVMRPSEDVLASGSLEHCPSRLSPQLANINSL
jgi:hypothetical protein